MMDGLVVISSHIMQTDHVVDGQILIELIMVHGGLIHVKEIQLNVRYILVRIVNVVFMRVIVINRQITLMVLISIRDVHKIN